MTVDIHPQAAEGFSRAAASYVRGRPGYPAALGGWLRDRLGLAPGKSAVDLGAGTGQFTSRLLACGAKVTALEPLAPMRRELACRLPEVTALSGRADALPLADESQDAVLAAQAFHWFARPEALAEIRRVLKPGGWLGLVWNYRDHRVTWVSALTEIMKPYARGTPSFADARWKAVFPAEGYAPLAEQQFSHSHSGPPEQVFLDRVLSVSYIAALPKRERAAVEARLYELIANTAELRGREAVTLPYITYAYSCHKLG